MELQSCESSSARSQAFRRVGALVTRCVCTEAIDRVNTTPPTEKERTACHRKMKQGASVGVGITTPTLTWQFNELILLVRNHFTNYDGENIVIDHDIFKPAGLRL